MYFHRGALRGGEFYGGGGGGRGEGGTSGGEEGGDTRGGICNEVSVVCMIFIILIELLTLTFHFNRQEGRQRARVTRGR